LNYEQIIIHICPPLLVAFHNFAKAPNGVCAISNKVWLLLVTYFLFVVFSMTIAIYQTRGIHFYRYDNCGKSVERSSHEETWGNILGHAWGEPEKPRKIWG